MRILDILETNFDYLDRESYENERYTQLFECICNEQPLLSTYEIDFFSKSAKKKLEKSTNKNSNTGSLDTKGVSPYLSKMSQECEILRKENEELRKMLGKSAREFNHKIEMTQTTE